MKKNKHTGDGIDWGNFCSATLFENAKNIAEGVTGGFKRKVKEAISRTTKRFVANILIFLGLVFLMVGLSVFLNEVLRLSNGIGYAVVGMLIVMIGVVINDQTTHRKN